LSDVEPSARRQDEGASCADAPPEGFAPFPRRGAFSQFIGPFYLKAQAEHTTHGFRVAPHHCNFRRILHGGMLAAFMDGVMAHAVASVDGRGGVTVHLSGDWLDMAREGDWVHGEASVTGADGDLVHVDGRAFCGQRPLWRGRALFKLMGRHG
jgi:acyl-coenzyme A thioesterase PaaI-like protein